MSTGSIFSQVDRLNVDVSFLNKFSGAFGGTLTLAQVKSKKDDCSYYDIQIFGDETIRPATLIFDDYIYIQTGGLPKENELIIVSHNELKNVMILFRANKKMWGTATSNSAVKRFSMSSSKTLVGGGMV